VTRKRGRNVCKAENLSQQQRGGGGGKRSEQLKKNRQNTDTASEKNRGKIGGRVLLQKKF